MQTPPYVSKVAAQEGLIGSNYTDWRCFSILNQCSWYTIFNSYCSSDFVVEIVAPDYG